MPVYIALLRAVNLGPHGKVAMPKLKEAFEAEGFDNVRTLLNSGNVVFSASKEPTEKQLEDMAAKRLGLSTDFFVRTPEEWEKLMAANPFSKEAADDPGHLVIMFLKNAAHSAEVPHPGREVIKVHGRQLYITYPDGIGTSKLTNAVIESKLKVRGTARNWNTVTKLAALAAG